MGALDQPTDSSGDKIDQIDRRRRALAAAVCLCMNDDHLTDLETLKRAWFYSETGRDEPVGSRTWEQLRVMVREHEANFKSEPV